MQRRKFINNTLTSGIGYAMYAQIAPYVEDTRRKPILKKGDVVGLICPGSAPEAKKIHLAEMQMRSYGLVPYVGKYAREKSGFLAGSDEHRIADLHEMYTNEKVKAIWAIRGGYGAGRLLPLMDFDLIKANPKPLIGYSDLTIPLNVIYQKTGIVNYHFTMTGTLIDEFSEQQVEQIFFDNKDCTYPFADDIVAHNERSGKGILLGGNLTVLCSLMGTPYEVDLDDSILFLEDVGEKPYRIDRMLSQMKQCGVFDNIKGLILGQFSDCEGELTGDYRSATELLLGYFEGMDIPIISNAPIGHIPSQWALPVGAKVKLNVRDRILKII